VGKAAMCIKMVEILNSRSLIKVSEIAELLETNPRNVLEYKKELEEAGYVIDTEAGRYGGYRLNRKHLFPSIKLSEIEKEKLNEGFKYLIARNDFLHKHDFSNAMSKIMSAITYQEQTESLTIINRFPLAMPVYELEKRYFTITQAMSKSNVLQVDYLSSKNKVKTHQLHPYKLFMFNNAWFMLAWNEKNGEIGYYKLNRIEKIEILNKKFVKSKTFNENEYIDQFGMKNNGEYYKIEILITGPNAAVIKERIYGKNQEIEEIDDDKTLLKVEMQNKEAIVAFVLGFGDQAKLTSPDWLINEIKQAATKVINKY
jgi:predicted DNA-binding transcriptional regulator YafY